MIVIVRLVKNDFNICNMYENVAQTMEMTGLVVPDQDIKCLHISSYDSIH